MNSKLKGRFVGVGVGPGDPELITIKSARVIKSAHVICYLANEQGHSQAKTIAQECMNDNPSDYKELAICVPMSTQRTLINDAYNKAAEQIKTHIEQGSCVVFLCEGDPLFYGSFIYLLERLQHQYPCEIIPGISSIHAASSQLKIPLTSLKESFAVVSGRHSEEYIIDTLRHYDTVVVIKAGRARARIISALKESGRFEDAHYLEYIGRDNERVISDISQLKEEVGPYFSLFLVVRAGRNLLS
jgi:precorrin-2/cobalt-factor-2 C20-methyltransferase